MKSTSWLWRGLSAATLVCLVALLAGFGWALKDYWIPSQGMAIPPPSRPPAAIGGNLASKPELKIAAMGDSLTKGTGDATANGYVKRAAESLSAAMGKPVRIVNNLAINGLRAEQLLKHLDDTGFVNAIVQSDIILFTIGGNDLFDLASNGGSLAQGGNLSPEELERNMSKAEKPLAEIMAKLRQINPVARIVYVGLYNPLYDLEKMRTASKQVQQWNSYAHLLAVADGNATVIPTYDLFESDIGNYLSSDHFHPNEAGYTRIAERVVQALQ